MKNIQTLFLKVASGVLITTLGVSTAFAAALTSMSDTLSTAKINTAANHTIVFTTPTGIAAGSSTVITFQSDFAIPTGFSFADIDINIGGPTLASSTLGNTAAGTTLGIATTTSTITITNGSIAIPALTTVYIRIGTNATFQSVGTFQIKNATTNGNKTVAVSGGTMFDAGTTTVDLLTNDAVAVNAVVPQSLTFSISSATIDFGNLTSASAKYASSTNTAGDTADTAAHSLAISTNAPSGYTITLQGQTLTSQQNPLNTITETGGTPAVSAPGTEQFGIYATKAGTGVNGTIASPYATASSFGYNATATTSATFASGSSSSATETYSLHYLANIAGVTEAGNYSTNLIYIGTSNF